MHSFSPGQGAQTIGMGRDLAEAYPQARAVFDEVDEALGEKLLASDLGGRDRAADAHAERAAALMATSMAAMAALKAEGVDVTAAAYVAGHSLGELFGAVRRGRAGSGGHRASPGGAGRRECRPPCRRVKARWPRSPVSMSIPSPAWRPRRPGTRSVPRPMTTIPRRWSCPGHRDAVTRANRDRQGTWRKARRCCCRFPPRFTCSLMPAGGRRPWPRP